MQKPVDTDIDFLSPEFFTSEEAQLEMTTTEMEGARINLSLLKVVAFMGGSKAVTSEEVESYLAQAEEWLGTKLKDLSLDNNNNNSPILKTTATCLHPGTPSAPSWTYLHEMFTTLESLKAISLIISVSSKKGSKSTKLPKDRVDRLSGLIRQAHESIRANTRILKSRISEPGVLGHLIELVLSGPDGEQGKELRAELEKTLDTSALELFCGSLKESWDEGLDGVMEVSL